MPVVENRSNTRDEVVFIRDTVNDTVLHEGSIVDTSNYPLGVTFVVEVTSLQPTEIYLFTLEEGDESDLSDASVINDNSLTAPVTDLTRSTANGLLNDVQGTFLRAIGVFNVKQFVRISGQATVSGVTGQVRVLVREGIDGKPVVNDVPVT